MKQLLRKMHKKGAGVGGLIAGGVGVIVGAIVIVALLPVFYTFVGTTDNLTASDQSLLGLIPTFLIIALIIGAVAVTGILGARKF